MSINNLKILVEAEWSVRTGEWARIDERTDRKSERETGRPGENY